MVNVIKSCLTCKLLFNGCPYGILEDKKDNIDIGEIDSDSIRLAEENALNCNEYTQSDKNSIIENAIRN